MTHRNVDLHGRIYDAFNARGDREQPLATSVSARTRCSRFASERPLTGVFAPRVKSVRWRGPMT
jgi:hypothetical protein